MNKVKAVFKTPLQWPAKNRRTPVGKVRSSGFRADRTLGEAAEGLALQIAYLHGHSLTITLNEPGTEFPYVRKMPNPAGVAAYFYVDGKEVVFACDKWRTQADNIWAIRKHLEALQGQHRWGVGSREQAFAGYAALPAPPKSKTCFEILGVQESAPIDLIKAAYRDLVKQHHPDVGGSNQTMALINDAYQEAIQKLTVNSAN